MAAQEALQHSQQLDRPLNVRGMAAAGQQRNLHTGTAAHVSV